MGALSAALAVFQPAFEPKLDNALYG